MSVSIKQALQNARQQFDVGSADLDAELLLCHVLEKNRSYLRAWPEKEISSERLDQFSQLIDRRKHGEPVAYILGNQEFWSLLLKVTPATLIPRPETELLVEQALMKLQGIANPIIVDLGTGSGAIALAIASERPDALVVATDYSLDALVVASGNAKQLGLTNVFFVNASWLDCFAINAFDLVVSNPPYIEVGDPDLASDVRRYEPGSALVSDDSGLADIKIIARQSSALLGSGSWLMLEHGWMQASEVKNVLQNNDFVNGEILKDLAGHDRVTIAQKK
ncbi:MAG: peptide chain release factor N(5)-glutamine methyltransferase [Gammaproteobacteria bacterium]|nr:peptide chain release factor N(5)-glutamine methyltransferase [Gammaproteobacteria bacterium]